MTGKLHVSQIIWKLRKQITHIFPEINNKVRLSSRYFLFDKQRETGECMDVYTNRCSTQTTDTWRPKLAGWLTDINTDTILTRKFQNRWNRKMFLLKNFWKALKYVLNQNVSKNKSMLALHRKQWVHFP